MTQESNTIFKNLQKVFNILDSAISQIRLVFNHYHNGILFLRDLIALVMSSGEKIIKFEELLILKMVIVKVKLLIIIKKSHI